MLKSQSLHRRWCLALAVLPLGGASFASAALISSTLAFKGVTLDSYVETTPRVNRINVMVIDLLADGIRFQMTPRNGVAGQETNTETTRNYVSRVNAQAGLNMSFFNLGTSPNDNLGILVSNGDKISPNDADKRPGFNITSTNVAQIFNNSGAAGTYETVTPVINPGNLYNAASGSDIIITGGNVQSLPTTGSFYGLNPRTAVATTTDNKLIWLTVDGRQTGFSEGMTLPEMATFLKTNYPAINRAINMDGGGSTTMVADYYYDGQGTQLVNNPQGERSNGSNLALFADPATPPPPAPPPNKVVIETFATNKGKFTSLPNGSGSTTGLSNAASTTALTYVATGGFGDNEGHLKIDLVANNTDTVTGWTLRALSGGGVPGNNTSLVGDGFIGYWLKTSDPTLQVSIILDEASTGAHERGEWQTVIADGQWHLYEWDLDDAGDWAGFAGTSSGSIDSNVSVDALYFRSTVETTGSLFYVDNLLQNTTGSVALLVPEPSLAGLLLPALLTLCRRR